MENKELQFNLDDEFKLAMQEVQTTSEAYQRALGRLQYLQTVAQRLNPPASEEKPSELIN